MLSLSKMQPTAYGELTPRSYRVANEISMPLRFDAQFEVLVPGHQLNDLTPLTPGRTIPMIERILRRESSP